MILWIGLLHKKKILPRRKLPWLGLSYPDSLKQSSKRLWRNAQWKKLSHQEGGGRPWPQTRVFQEGHSEWRMERYRVDEGERPIPPQGQKRVHDELLEIYSSVKCEGTSDKLLGGFEAFLLLKVSWLTIYRLLFHLVTFESDDTSNPWNHVCRFDNTALLHCYSDGVKC